MSRAPVALNRPGCLHRLGAKMFRRPALVDACARNGPQDLRQVRHRRRNFPAARNYENAVRIGLPAKLEDKESEVDVTLDLKTASLSFRWFWTEAACNAAAQSNHDANASPDPRWIRIDGSPSEWTASPPWPRRELQRRHPEAGGVTAFGATRRPVRLWREQSGADRVRLSGAPLPAPSPGASLCPARSRPSPDAPAGLFLWSGLRQPQDDLAVALARPAQRAGRLTKSFASQIRRSQRRRQSIWWPEMRMWVEYPQTVLGDASSGGVPSRMAPLMSVRKSGVSLCPWTLTAC